MSLREVYAGWPATRIVDIAIWFEFVVEELLDTTLRVGSDLRELKGHTQIPEPLLHYAGVFFRVFEVVAETPPQLPPPNVDALATGLRCRPKEVDSRGFIWNTSDSRVFVGRTIRPIHDLRHASSLRRRFFPLVSPSRR